MESAKVINTGEAAKGEKYIRLWSPSLRRHYPDQVLRVLSQPFCLFQPRIFSEANPGKSTPRNLRKTSVDVELPAEASAKIGVFFHVWPCNIRIPGYVPPICITGQAVSDGTMPCALAGVYFGVRLVLLSGKDDGLQEDATIFK
jgi:hypothetical protein